MINIGIKKKIGDIEIYAETAVENNEKAKVELRNLNELIRSCQKELFPESEKSGMSSGKISYLKG
ncbi:Uncharacterised protein [uncultured archaeon]|nr:Uncharacterised protein [uncultured archaeon]